MDKLTIFLTFALALSTATERITELLKKLCCLEPKEPEQIENPARKGGVVFLSLIVGGAFTAFLPPEVVNNALGISGTERHYMTWLFCGALASSGSGFWNSLLGIVREVDQQKQAVSRAIQELPLVIKIDEAEAKPGITITLRGQGFWGDEVVLIVNDYPQAQPQKITPKSINEVSFPFPSKNPIQQADWDAKGDKASIAVRVKRGTAYFQSSPITIPVK